MKFRKSNNLAGLKPLRNNVIIGKKVRLREKKLSDVRNDYRWQSDPELAKLDAAPTLDMPFAIYLLDYSSSMRRKDKRYPLAIDTLEGKHIGNCTCYDIDEKKGEAQIGIMVGDKDCWDKGYGADAIKTLVDHVFKNTDLNRLYLKTLDWNNRAHQCFMKCGFADCGKLKQSGHTFTLMELTREQWELMKNQEKQTTNQSNGRVTG